MGAERDTYKYRYVSPDGRIRHSGIQTILSVARANSGVSMARATFSRSGTERRVRQPRSGSGAIRLLGIRVRDASRVPANGVRVCAPNQLAHGIATRALGPREAVLPSTVTTQLLIAITRPRSTGSARRKPEESDARSSTI